MASYTHLTIRERELIYLYHGFGFSYRRIGRLVKRSPSTVMRELKRHSTKKRAYSPSIAQKVYTENKKRCGKKRLLDSSELKKCVRKLFLEEQWSPEQISQRIKLESNGQTISYNTIYRSIYRGLFNDGFTKDSKGAKDANELARMIQIDVYKRTGIYTTVGIGDNPLLAKFALDLESKKNPHMRAEWRYEDVPEKLWTIDNLTDVWGIGSKTAVKLYRMGIFNIHDLAHANYYKLKEKFGVLGTQLYANSWGIAPFWVKNILRSQNL